MSCLPIKGDRAKPAHFSGAGVLDQVRTDTPEDPIAAWLDLMEVVEALCPQWPERSKGRGGDYRL
jgi:hypothetical protein